MSCEFVVSNTEVSYALIVFLFPAELKQNSSIFRPRTLMVLIVD